MMRSSNNLHIKITLILHTVYEHLTVYMTHTHIMGSRMWRGEGGIMDRARLARACKR